MKLIYLCTNCCAKVRYYTFTSVKYTTLALHRDGYINYKIYSTCTVLTGSQKYQNHAFIKDSNLTVLSNSKKIGFDVKCKRRFSTTGHLYVGYKIKENLRDCYSLLNIKETCTLEELKEAYLKLAKVYHPDSQSTTADPKKFSQIRDAYDTIKAKIERDSQGDTYINLYDLEEDEEDNEDRIATKAQHRQYLSNQGFGYGTAQQRQRQYDQYRVDKVHSEVFKYKAGKIPVDTETALTLKEKRAIRRQKISNTLERLAEDMIQEAMSKGEFENLSTAGKPLDLDRDPHKIDKTTSKLNEILLDSGLQPDWIMLQKEIRDDLHKLRVTLASDYTRLGKPPFSGDKLTKWNSHIDTFSKGIQEVNKQISRYNLMVPLMNNQMFQYRVDKEVERITQNASDYLPDDFVMFPKLYNEHKFEYYVVPSVSPVQSMSSSQEMSPFTWNDIWTDLKQLIKKKN